MTTAVRKGLLTCLNLFLLTMILLPATGCKRTVRKLTAKFHHRKSVSKENTTDYAADLDDVVGTAKLDIMRWPDYSNYQPQVQQFYEDRSSQLAWTRDLKPTDATTQLIALFDGAAQKGLNPEDYDGTRWAARLQAIEAVRKAADGSDQAQQTVAQFDVAVTIAAMRYFSDLHVGRVNPQALNFDIDVPAKRAAFNVVDFINEKIVDADNLSSLTASLEPQNPMYTADVKALAQYIALAKQQHAMPHQDLPPVAKAVTPGGSYAALPQLLQRLQFEGLSSTTMQPTTYDEGLAASVRDYQNRHGLTADGKLTQATIDSLNVPMDVRVQQLGDSLERFRWLPDGFVQPRLFVNLPEFVVRAYEPDHSLAFKMKVVDGEAQGEHDTPMFVRTMRYVVFRPYWNLPSSIVKKEIVAHVQKSGKGYLDSHDYEVTTANGTVVTDYSAEDIEHLKYAVRQKPGPKNSLGLVKFLFPNEYDVYMHSTPELNLFDLTRRDRSHGCVRLQHADQMAAWVLSGQGDWDIDKVNAAMTSTTEDNKTINLKTTLPVVITYLTANVDEDGKAHFFDDIYGYDKELDNALAKGRPYAQAEAKINPKLTPGETE